MVINLGTPFPGGEGCLIVEAGKNIRNQDVFRTDIQTVAASRTLDHVLVFEDVPNLEDRLQLLVGKGFEVFHDRNILRNLVGIAGPGKDGFHTFKGSWKTESIGCRALGRIA